MSAGIGTQIRLLYTGMDSRFPEQHNGKPAIISGAWSNSYPKEYPFRASYVSFHRDGTKVQQDVALKENQFIFL